jgi:selenophosphate synthetase-related protein
VTDIDKVTELRDLILNEWSDAMSDSGYVWTMSHKKLTAALDLVDEETKEKAYVMAYAKWGKRLDAS